MILVYTALSPLAANENMNRSPELHKTRLSLKGYHFKPRWSLTLATLLLLGVFISLGFWQLGRAKEKTTLQQLYQNRLQAAPTPLNQLPPDIDLRYYPVTITGQYDVAHSILLDNKINQHRIGYEVITPFIIPNEKKVVLVNRGWIPAGQNRSQLPALTNVPVLQTLHGVIYIVPGRPFTLGEPVEAKEQWPLRIQAIVIPAVAKALQQPIYPFIVLLDPKQNYGFTRDWQPINTPAHKHTGYAVQWFTFAGVLIIIFVALNTRKRKNSYR